MAREWCRKMRLSEKYNAEPLALLLDAARAEGVRAAIEAAAKLCSDRSAQCRLNDPVEAEHGLEAHCCAGAIRRLSPDEIARRGTEGK